jgi:hypothetical protein
MATEPRKSIENDIKHAFARAWLGATSSTVSHFQSFSIKILDTDYLYLLHWSKGMTIHLSVKNYALDDRVVRMCTNSSKSMCELPPSATAAFLPSSITPVSGSASPLATVSSGKPRSKWFAVDRSEADQSISGHRTTVLKIEKWDKQTKTEPLC